MNSKGDPYEKRVLYVPETHPNILRGGHGNPYQLENAIKSGGTVFCWYHLGAVSYELIPRSVKQCHKETLFSFNQLWKSDFLGWAMAGSASTDTICLLSSPV